MENPSYRVAVDINAPIGEVYDYIADFPRHTEWNHSPTKMTPLTEGPTRVGSQYRTVEQSSPNMSFTQKMMFAVMTPVLKLWKGMADYTEAEVTVLDRPHLIAWQARLPANKSDLMRMQWEIQLTEQGDGTHVEQFCRIAPPDDSLFAGMAKDEAMKATAMQDTQANLDRLKAILEGQQI